MEDSQSPPWGNLKAGITPNELLNAINISGYPFQAEVADQIRAEFSDFKSIQVQEEWSFVDGESQTVRSLDIYTEVSIWSKLQGYDTLGDHQTHPLLNILVECKQSDLPYIFFLRLNQVSPSLDFPEIGGVESSNMRLYPAEWQDSRSRDRTTGVFALLT